MRKVRSLLLSRSSHYRQDEPWNRLECALPKCFISYGDIVPKAYALNLREILRRHTADGIRYSSMSRTIIGLFRLASPTTLSLAPLCTGSRESFLTRVHDPSDPFSAQLNTLPKRC